MMHKNCFFFVNIYFFYNVNELCLCMYDLYEEKKIILAVCWKWWTQYHFLSHLQPCIGVLSFCHRYSYIYMKFHIYSLILWTFLSMQFLFNNKTCWPSAMLWIFLIYVLLWNEKKVMKKNQIKKAIQIFWYTM